MEDVDRPDQAVEGRHRENLLATCVREIPIAAIAFTVIIVSFDLLTLASGISLPAAYLASDVVQGGAFLLTALLVGRRLAPAEAAPWLWSGAIIVSAIVLVYQYSFDPGGAGIGILIMLMSVYGALTLFWRPFLISAPVILGVTAYGLLDYQPDYSIAWTITAATALGVSAALLFGRRRSAMDGATASLLIEEIATRDHLTGLLNRYGLMESAEVLNGLATRTGQGVFALFVDVGGLKAVNDRHGHDAGDTVLVRTADAARAASRAGDLVVRWGGDEFLIVGIGDQPQVLELELRMGRLLDLHGLDGVWDGELHIGAATSTEWSLEHLIGQADQDMYRNRTP